jgi:uncharacterized protein (TIGR03437 family)
VGQGHVQELQDAGSSPVRYLVGISDRSSTAYVVSSAILARYEALGGPAGDLGYPASDATPGNRQLFENSVALAGNPVRLVSGSMLAKWATLGYETGPAGPPTGDPVAFVSFMATSGIAQQFRGGAIYIHSSGRGFLVTGLILAKYAGMGGPTGRLGAPTTDEFASSGLRKQEFEGGEVEYGPQDSEARVIERERRPSVSATPGAVVAGTRVRVAVGGFPPGATLRVSISGQPDFVVTTESGAYSWDVFVPPNAPTSAVIVRAMDMTSQTSAQGGYTIRAANEVQLQLTKVRGDMQTGAPATTLPLPLRVAIKDDRGNPVIGFQVRFNASPGAQVMPGSALTNESGEAEAWLRAGSTEGVALATVEAGRQVVTFSARVAAVSLPNFPKLMASDQGGALLAASASLLRYHQNRGELPAPNGPVEVAALNQHLKNYCALDFEGVQVCDGFLQGQVVNLWRLGSFVNNGIDVSVERPEIAVVRDFVAQGSPVLIALTLTCTSCPGGAMLGSHFVVATGVNQGGAILVHDPSSLFARPMLDDYLAGFTVSQTGVKGSLAAAVRLLPRTPAAAPFVVTATDAEIGLTSAAGSCGSPVEWAVAAATLQSAPSVVLRQRGCDGSQAEYQLDLLAQDSQRATITDLSAGGSRYEVTPAGAASYSVSRLGARWVLAPQATSISPGGIVNAASFTPGISPGGLMAVFGAGLARGPDHPRVEMNGLPAAVVTASPFQVNAQVPTEVQPGSHILRIQSPYGSAEQSVEVRETAPAIFVVGNGRAAILNQDATLNGPSNPERRGRVVVVFATGLGAVTLQGPFQIAGKSVTVVISGRELQPAFAGLTPGFIGLYQVNIPLPVEIPPGLAQTLFLRQGGADSNRVEVAIQ